MKRCLRFGEVAPTFRWADAGLRVAAWFPACAGMTIFRGNDDDGLRQPADYEEEAGATLRGGLG